LHPDFPIAAGEIDPETFERSVYPWIEGDDGRQLEDYPMILGLDINESLEAIQ